MKRRDREAPANAPRPDEPPKTGKERRLENLRSWPPPDPDRVPFRPTYTKEQNEEHERLVEQLSAQGMTEKAIIARCRAEVGISRSRVRRLIARVNERWLTVDKTERRFYRVKAIHRLENIAQIATNGIRKQARDKSGKPIMLPDGTPKIVWDLRPNPNAAVRAIEILSRIQGIQAPIEINLNVHVSDALVGIVANLTSDEVQERLTRAREDRALAQAARDKGLQLPPAPTENAAE